MLYENNLHFTVTEYLKKIIILASIIICYEILLKNKFLVFELSHLSFEGSSYTVNGLCIVAIKIAGKV